ncbi:hypothetical protein SRABI80_03090 [Peribacillus frigoritolerans]|nr:hypothetical protein SRABI80_03090 [Peribacillus frigoritolerans]
MERERQGLWGELFFITQAGNIKSFMKHWHKEPNRKFDFVKDCLRLEVKSTSLQERIHAFSHQQLFNSKPNETVIASLILRKEDEGLSLRELITTVFEHISDDLSLIIKLEKARRLAGMETPMEIGPIYDERFAKENLKFYHVSNVPQFPLPEPPGVTDTRYNVDLSTIRNIPDNELDKWMKKW